MMRCNQCGFQSEYEIRFCPSCGSSIEQAGENNKQVFQIEDEPGFASSDAEYIKPVVIPVDNESVITYKSNQEYINRGLLESGQENGWRGVSEEDLAREQAGRRPYRKPAKAKLLLGLSVLVAVIALVYAIFLMDKPTTVFYELFGPGIQVYTSDDVTLVLDRDGNVLQSFDGPSYSQYCRDKSAAVIFMMKTDSIDFKAYYVTAEECLELGDGITTCDMSADGRYIIYALRTKTNTYQLYRYDTKNKKETLLHELEGKQVGLIRLSPDGKTIAYTVFPMEYYSNEGRQVETFLIKEGKEPEFMEERITIAVSNGAEYIYSCDMKEDGSNPLYVSKNGEEIKLRDQINSGWISWDYSEMLFADENKTYLYDGRTGSIWDIAASMATEIIRPYPYMSSSSGGMLQLASYDTFKNKVIRCNNNTLYAINHKYEVKMICNLDLESQVALSLDGKSLLYSTAEGSIYKIDDIFDECKETILVKEMDSFITNGDLSEVYYLIGDELFYKSNRGEVKWITDGVTGLTSNGDFSDALFQMDPLGFRRVLYYSRKGSKPKQLFDGAYISDIRHVEHGVVVQVPVPGGFEYYYNYEGSRMKPLQDEIME